MQNKLIYFGALQVGQKWRSGEPRKCNAFAVISLKNTVNEGNPNFQQSTCFGCHRYPHIHIERYCVIVHLTWDPSRHDWKIGPAHLDLQLFASGSMDCTPVQWKLRFRHLDTSCLLELHVLGMRSLRYHRSYLIRRVPKVRIALILAAILNCKIKEF